MGGIQRVECIIKLRLLLSKLSGLSTQVLSANATTRLPPPLLLTTTRAHTKRHMAAPMLSETAFSLQQECLLPHQFVGVSM